MLLENEMPTAATPPARPAIDLPPGCKLVGLIRRYTGSRCSAETVLDPQTDTVAGPTPWSCQWQVTPVPGRAECLDIATTFTLLSGQAEATGVAVALELADWTPANYVLLPAAAYNGNRLAVAPQPYPPLWRDARNYRPDMPPTITDLPRLNTGAGRSCIELSTGDVTTPAMGFQSAGTGRGCLITTVQQTRLGNSGLTVEEHANRRSARFMVSAPCVRQQQYRFNAGGMTPGDETGAAWKRGDTVVLRLRVWFFAAPRVQDLFDAFAIMRKDLAPPTSIAPQLPMSAAWQILQDKYNRQNWDEAWGYYRVAVDFHTTFAVNERPLCFLWQAGWVGGGMVTHSLLFAGSETSRQRAWRNLEMIFERTPAPSGFLYGIGDGEKFYSDGFDTPHPGQLHMVRKSADLLFWALKQFDLLGRQGQGVPPAWQASVRRLADAFVRLWERYGQFGQFVDVQTGDLLIGGSTAGAAAPAGLALAATWFKDPRYLTVAKAAARHYCLNDLKRGLITGGPGEILSAPDSESAYALFESLVVLYEVSGEAQWLTAARDMLRHLATWVVSYDYVFPPDSTLGKAQVRTTGAVWANVQNKHAAPAFCTASGDALLKYWRATADPLALDLLRDLARGLPQYLARPSRCFNDRMQPGWMCERVNMSDWEGREGIGGNLFGSCWAEVSLMAQTVEIPGLYVQPDTGLYCVFDHLTAECLSRNGHGLTLRLANPTAFPAVVRVLCEPSTATRRPLGVNALYNGRTITIAPGQSVVETFT